MCVVMPCYSFKKRAIHCLHKRASCSHVRSPNHLVATHSIPTRTAHFLHYTHRTRGGLPTDVHHAPPTLFKMPDADDPHATTTTGHEATPTTTAPTSFQGLKYSAKGFLIPRPAHPFLSHNRPQPPPFRPNPYAQNSSPKQGGESQSALSGVNSLIGAASRADSGTKHRRTADQRNGVEQSRYDPQVRTQVAQN